VKIRSPIEQHMIGRGGLFRQENIEKRRNLSVREWVELCRKDEFKAPGVGDVGLHARTVAAKVKATTKRRRTGIGKVETVESDPEDDSLLTKQESVAENHSVNDYRPLHSLLASSESSTTPTTPITAHGAPESEGCPHVDCEMTEIGSGSPQSRSRPEENAVNLKLKGSAQTREAKEANLAARATRDAAFLETFDPHSHWLPPNTTPSDYTPEFCQKLERQYWRNCGLGRPAWYGADCQG